MSGRLWFASVHQSLFMPYSLHGTAVNQPAYLTIDEKIGLGPWVDASWGTIDGGITACYCTAMV
jgi:hypothetical protein